MKNSIERDFPMPEDGAGIIKVYRQAIPAVRFIGKNFGGGRHPDWGAAWSSDVFGKIERSPGYAPGFYEDSNAYLGFYHRSAEGGGHDGWVGMFAPPETEVPEGLSHIDFPAQHLGVCWLYGKREDVYGLVLQCAAALEGAGMEIRADAHGPVGFFERDLCPRFTTPDEKGNIIVDYCYFVK